MFVVDNFYAIEPWLISRLKEKCPRLCEVANGSTMSGQDIAKLINPAAAFIFPKEFGYSDARQGKSIKLSQKWEIDICVPHIRDMAEKETTTALAGAFILQVIQAISGQKPPGFADTIRLSKDQLEPVFSTPGGGYAVFPVAFDVPFVIQGDLT
jgi:hypothetical protein